MTDAARPRPGADDGTLDASEVPEVSVCESVPGRTVFMEADNVDGWIASDVVVELPR